MFIRFFYIFILFLYSCDINRNPIPVSNLDQDNLKYKKLHLDLTLSDTLKKINKIGGSSLLYTGSLNDTDYVYSIFSFDKEIFQNYDLCDSDSLSFRELYMVIDIIKKYSLNENNSDINHNSNNTNQNISLDASPFFAYWISYDELKDSEGNNILDQNWQEDDLKTLNGIDFSSLLHTLNQEILDTILNDGDYEFVISEPNQRLFIDHHLGKYYINISDQLIGNENDCAILDESSCLEGCIWIDDECSELKSLNICNSNIQSSYFLLLASNPTLDFLYEIASSEYTSDYSNTEPYLNIVYDEYEELTKVSNKFIVNNATNQVGSSFYIADTLINNHNSFFIANFLNNELEPIGSMEVLDSVLWSNYDCDDNDEVCINSFVFMESDTTNQEEVLIDIEIDLINEDNFDSTGINFWLDNIRYIEYQSDPNNDNWVDANNNEIWDEDEGTENNQIYDNGEFYQDYGLDQCPDMYEDAENGCLCDYPFEGCDESALIYNFEGTQGNNQFDLGENYYDLGSDGCSDEDERGAILNDDGTIDGELSWLCGVCEPNEVNDIDNDGICDFDPNNDNYNIDPSEDDWNDINNNSIWDVGEGTENNNKWDDGEIFLDFGLDGLSQNDIGYSDEDGTESNGIYDFYDLNGDGIQQSTELGEPYFDYGFDGLKNLDESGYNDDGTEANNTWDSGEVYEDCGEDGICDDQDTSDDWNADPNKDFWLDCGSDHICPGDEAYIEADSNGTEKNSIWDNAFCSNSTFSEQNECEDNGLEWYEAEFAEGNSIWNEGEFYQDYGLDQTQDQDELFILDQKVSVSNTDSTFYNYLNEEVVFYPGYLNQEEDEIKIWISSITKTDLDSKLKVEVSYMNNPSIVGVEFRLNHEIYSIDILDWNEKTRNVAKVDNSSYIKDASLFNNNLSKPYNSLFMNYAYGISTKLNFNGLDTLINDAKQNGYIINEANSYLKLFLNKSDDFYLKSNSYIINFNELDSIENKLLFSYFVPNNPDSIIVPVGNLLQNYINNVSNYNDGIVINLETNQYPPIFNFNNILIDTLKPPILQVYYFE